MHNCTDKGGVFPGEKKAESWEGEKHLKESIEGHGWVFCYSHWSVWKRNKFTI